MARQANLLTLPMELVVETLSFTDACTILRASQVCKFLATVFHESAELQYIVELFAAGLSPNPACTSWSTKACLDRLRDRRTAWVSPAWDIDSAFYNCEDLPFDSKPGTASSCPRSTVSSGILCVWDGSKIFFKELSSKFRCTPAKEWSIDIEKFEIYVVHIVPEYGLLFVIENTPTLGEIVIHLRDMYTGENHLQAAEPRLVEVREGARVGDQYTIKTDSRGSYFCLHYSFQPFGTVVVWDWQRGEKIFNEPESSICSISLLDDTHLAYMMSMDIADGLDVGQIVLGRPPRSRVFLKVVDLVEYEHVEVVSANQMEKVHTWAFVYPILFNVQSTETVLDMTCGHVDTSSQSQPFLSEEPSLLVTTVEVVFYRPGRPNMTYVHAIPIQPLLERVRNAEPGTDAFPWSQWSKDTLMFPYNHEDTLHEGFFFNVHGWTLMIPAIASGSGWTVYDFNPREAKRAAALPESLGLNGMAHIGLKSFGGPNDPNDAGILDVGRAGSLVTTGIPYRIFEEDIPNTEDTKDIQLTNGGIIFVREPKIIDLEAEDFSYEYNFHMF